MRLVAICTPELCIAAPLAEGTSCPPFVMFDAVVGDGPGEILAELAARGVAVDLAACAEVLERAEREGRIAAMCRDGAPVDGSAP